MVAAIPAWHINYEICGKGVRVPLVYNSQVKAHRY